MIIEKMTRRCTYWHRVYTYNPSVGDLGFVCKFGGSPQFPAVVLKDYADNGTDNR